MKKITLLITITFLIISCQNNETIVNKNVGKILSGNNKGSTYSIGSMEHAQLALDFSNAFVNQDYDFVVDFSTISGVTPGTHRMRLRGEDDDQDGDVLNPCDDLEFGRTNDYTANISGGVYLDNTTLQGGKIVDNKKIISFEATSL